MNYCKHRQSNIELLRIIAMLLIVAHHLAVHSGFCFEPYSVSVNALFIQLLSLGGKVGVNVFLLISGYFLIDQPNISIIKILKLWGQILFYSVALYIGSCIIGRQIFQLSLLLQAMQPISSSCWWFASTYFVMYLFSPFISIGLSSLSQKRYTYLLFLIILLWCVIPTFLNRYMESNNLLWFFSMYCIGGYLKKYGLPFSLSATKSILVSIILMLLAYAYVCYIDIEATRYTDITHFVLTYFGMQELFILLISIFLFWGFSQMKLAYISWINKLASATFGVYLIHDISFMRDLLWKSTLHVADYSNSSILVIRSIFLVFTVYLFCSLIELIRIATIERIFLIVIKSIRNIFVPKNQY